jgi:LPS-assembly lipoprotein
MINRFLLVRGAVILLLLLLSACGFRMRGDFVLSEKLKSVQIEGSNSYSPLLRSLNKALIRSGARVDQSNAKKVTIIRITVDQMTDQALSVNRVARVQEYQMLYRVEFDVVDAAGVIVLNKKSIELRREYTFDENRALGVQAQKDLLKQELERDMVQHVLRHLESIR